MYLKCRDIIDMVEKLAPPSLAAEYDNVGLLIGDEESIIRSVMVSLDINDNVIDEAIYNDCNLIITHHPVIFSSLKSINTMHFKERMIYRLISNNINVYSAHTNLDACENGINDFLAQKLGLTDISVINTQGEYGFIRVGYLKVPLTLKEMCLKVKNMLNISSLKVIGNLNKPVKKVAICSGSGADFIDVVYRSGCDVYITGDIKYHCACDVRDMEFALIDAGHYETENIYMEFLQNYISFQLKNKNYDVNVILSKKNINPFVTL